MNDLKPEHEGVPTIVIYNHITAEYLPTGILQRELGGVWCLNVKDGRQLFLIPGDWIILADQEEA